MGAVSQNDERWMRLALALARRAEGQTRPNPPVGAVVVGNGRLVGAGWHRRAGGPHAEVFALRAAGARARGATLYVTLEPCSTWGRTPPCTDLVLRSGVRRVVAAIRDPNPRHRGRGLRLLARAGLAVESGVCRAEAEDLLAPFTAWATRGRPWLTLKLGVSLDGRIADAAGESKWITGPAARRRVRALRQRCDALLVGGGTARADDPGLKTGTRARLQPLRVIVSARGRLPRGAQVLTDAQRGMTVIATSGRCPARRREEWSAAGAQVWTLPATAGGVDLGALLARLHGAGCLHAVCEGGGELAAALVRAGLVDEYWFFVAPRLLGGGGVPAIGGRGWPLRAAPALRIVACERVGADVLIRARPAGKGR